MRAAERYERVWGRSAHASLCVTRAMQRELAKSWRVPATVFYDRPPDFFRPASLQARVACSTAAVRLAGVCGGRRACDAQWWRVRAGCVLTPLPPSDARFHPQQEKHALLLKLQPELAAALHPADFCAELYASGRLGPGDTLCTSGGAGGGRAGGSGAARERQGRPALVVSSTSWTPDEDFGLLLRAAQVGSREGEWVCTERRVLLQGRSTRHAADPRHPTSLHRHRHRHRPPQLYDARAQRSRHPGRYPRILFLVTGRGPQRAEYEARMRGLDLRHVAFRQAKRCCYPLLPAAWDSGRGWGRRADGRMTPWHPLCHPALPPVHPQAGRCGWSPETTLACWAAQTWASACTPPPPASTFP